MNKVYLELLGRLFEDRLQSGVHKVCDEPAMVHLYESIEHKLEEFKRDHTVPPNLSGITPFKVGFRTTKRLLQAMDGCRWFVYTSKQEFPFQVDPSKGPARSDKRETRKEAWSRLIKL